MISRRKTNIIIKKQNIPVISPRLLELQKKIQDPDYVDNAIQRIAQVISKRLIENPEEDPLFGYE